LIENCVLGVKTSPKRKRKMGQGYKEFDKWGVKAWFAGGT